MSVTLAVFVQNSPGKYKLVHGESDREKGWTKYVKTILLQRRHKYFVTGKQIFHENEENLSKKVREAII